jgi:hypothetical protein
VPIQRIAWGGSWGGDLHVLRGGATSPNLSTDALFFLVAPGDWQLAGNYQTAHAGDVTLTFQPLFKGAQNGDLFENFGIHVNTKTGQVRVDAAVPAPPLRTNFLLEVTAENAVGHAKFTEVIRVQIHQSPVRIWLTPDKMTIRPRDATRPQDTTARFTVRAEFDDGAVGDVTRNHGIVVTPAVNVQASGELRLAAADAPGTDVTITATYNWSGPARTANATLHVGQPWVSEPAIPQAAVVVGGGWPGTIRPEAVPNILILGDGFLGDGLLAGDHLFEAFTNGLVQHMKANRLMRPFDLLATSMNFWRAFLPASARGISVRSEVYTFAHGGGTGAQPIEGPARPPATDPWTVQHLLYVAGLPLPGDAAKSADDLRTEWVATLPAEWAPAIQDHGKVANDVVKDWQRRSARAFIDEVDGFPALAYGRPPAANQDSGWDLRLHEDRGGQDRGDQGKPGYLEGMLKSFYRQLHSANGVTLDGGKPIGLLWAEKDPNLGSPTNLPDVHFDNTDLVVLLTPLPMGRAVNGSGWIGLSTKTENAILSVTQVTGRRFTLSPPPPPPTIAADSCRTLTHEIAHSFGLGDEYTEFRARYQNQADPLKAYGNLATETSVKDGANHFAGDQVKWNWHRIAKAAVIAGPIADNGGTFTIPLVEGQGHQFAKGDLLLIRRRLRGVALAKLAANDILRQGPGAPDFASPPAELKITGDPTSNSIAVQPVGAVDSEGILRFKPGCIVYLPTPAPASVKSAAYPYAEMVALNIRNAINANRPLTPVPCADKVIREPIAPDLTGVDLPGLCFKHKPRIIGLYEGGAQYTCGIFHPAGECMMNGSHEESAEFCAVCRYVLVDFVDPYQHWAIDRDYAEVYPLK